MERKVHIKATKKEIDFWSLYSYVSTPKLWGKDKYLKDNIYLFTVSVRLPESCEIKENGTYTFKNFLTRTKDLGLLKLKEDFENLLENYRENCKRNF